MGAIENFLRRWGYARLDKYGLVLTPEGRVLTTRPAVLDDGLGGKIVGWLEGDLAAMELEHWGPPKKKPKKLIAAPASLHSLPPRAAVPTRAMPPVPPVVAPPIAAVAAPIVPAPIAPAPIAPIAAAAPAPVAARTPIPANVPAPAPVLAAKEEPGEDEWEWEIAMAKARAAADDVEQARVDLLGASAVIASAVIPRKTSPGMAVVSPKSDPMASWPKTEELHHESWSDVSDPVQPRVLSPLQKALMVDKRPTVIPVPSLPAAADPRSVRPAPYTPSKSSYRMARGTGSPATPPVREDTVRTNALPANDDHTAPYIELPSEVKPSGFAHTKRVAAKQR